MPRNLTDLPLNDDPQDTDWLLGASGISPAVFQKIPVGLVKATSGGSSIFVPINEPTTLTEGGLFFTDTLASNLLVNFDSPPIGTYIRWLNYSSKSVVLGGFTTADGVTIPTDKGIVIASGGFLEGLVNSTGSFKKLSGNYTINWLPGVTVPVSLPWTSDSNLNGLINYLGTEGGTVSFTNPYPSKINLLGRTSTPGHLTPTLVNPSRLTDKNISNPIAFSGLSTTKSNIGVAFTFPGLILPSIIKVRIWNPGDALSLVFEGLKADNTYASIGTVTIPSFGEGWFGVAYTGGTQFKGFYFHAPNFYYSQIREFEVWGEAFVS